MSAPAMDNGRELAADEKMIKVKICGITNLEDALAAVNAGADMLGFICYTKSSRYVEPEMIHAIIEGVRDYRQRVAPQLPGGESVTRIPRFIGVFVNMPGSEVRRVMETTGLEFAQLHGDEPVDDLLAINGRGYKALRPQNLARALVDAELYAPHATHRGPHLLLDAFDPNAYGGTGQRMDWELATRVAAQTENMLLAGGLTPENVARAIRQVQPWGVDVSSGVESSPGVKDHLAVRRFVAAAKAA